MQLGRQVFHQECERIILRPDVEDVIVVQYQHELAGEGREVVEQACEDRLDGRGLRRPEGGGAFPPGATVCKAATT